MLRLVRWMLAYHDRHPYSAPLTLVLLAQVISVLPVLAGIGLLSLLHINEDLAVFMMAPWVIYIAPFYWASVLLSVEQMWRICGIMRLIGMRDDALKSMIAKLSKYQGSSKSLDE